MDVAAAIAASAIAPVPQAFHYPRVPVNIIITITVARGITGIPGLPFVINWDWVEVKREIVDGVEILTLPVADLGPAFIGSYLIPDDGKSVPVGICLLTHRLTTW